MIENFYLIFLWGMVAGLLGSMLGLGGGFIVSPILALIGLPPSQVSQTSLFAVVSTGASSTASYSLKKKVNFTNGIQIAVIAVPFAIIGALISLTLNQNDFRLYFAIILVLTSIYLLIRRPIAENHHTRIQRKILSNILFYCGCSTAGFISSMFGIGGGIIIVPILSVIKNLSMQESVATSQLSILIIAIAGILMHSFLAQPDYFLISSLSLGAIIGAQIGSFIATRISNRILTMIFSVFLIIMSIRFIFDYFL